MSKKYSLSKETGELRKLILENPDLPIVVPVSYTHLTLPTIYSV